MGQLAAPGKGSGVLRGAAPGKGPGAAPGKGPEAAPGKGLGAAPGKGPEAAPGKGPGAAPRKGPGPAPGKGQLKDTYRRQDQKNRNNDRISIICRVILSNTAKRFLTSFPSKTT